MATISDTYNLRNIGVNALRIADAVDALIVGVGNDTFGASNSTSTSVVDISGASFTIATVSGQALFMIGHIQLSHGTNNSSIGVNFDVDGSAQPQHVWTSRGVDTNGDDASLICTAILTAPSVGTHTIKLRWVTNTGTMYTNGGQIWAFAFRTS